jgi:hypothetical protein
MSTLGCATNLIEYVGNGTQTLYTFPFTYLESSDIYVELYDFTTRTWSITTEWTFQNATTIQFNTAPEAPPSTTPDYPNIIIFRRTNVDSIKATFYPGSAIRAEDLNDNFEEILFGTQETECRSTVAKTAAYSAANSAADAVAEAEAAVAAAEVATTVAEASAADAAQAVSSANTAITTANAAVITADSAVSTANTALTTSQTAETSAAGAQAAATTAQAAATTAASAASSAQSDAATASTAALNAEDTADSAVVTANNALSTAQTAISTANTADGKADTAISTSTDALATANSAAAAVGDALLFEIVPDVAAIPASPDDNDSVEVTNSTGIESFSPLTGLPSGFIGDPGINVDIRYVTDTWQFLSYSPNDPDNRYAGPNTGVGSATLPSIGFSGDRDTGIYHPSDGAVAITSNGTAVSQVDSNGIKIGGAVPSAPNIELNADGSAEFAGAVNVGNNVGTPDPTERGISLTPGGELYLSRPNTSGLIYGYRTGEAGVKFQLNNDGSASFAGDVQVGGESYGNAQGVVTGADGYIRATYSGTNDVFRGYQSGNTTATSKISADGSAAFAGGTAKIQPNGSFTNYVTNATAVSGTDSFHVWNTDASDYMARINGDGSATFAGTDISFSNEGSYGGKFTLYRDPASIALSIRSTADRNTDTVSINGNGSATFAGNIQANNPRNSTAGNNTGGLCINPSDTTIYYNFRVDEVDNELRIDTSQGADQIKFGPDGSATFAGPQVLASAGSPAGNGYTAFINNTVASTAACFTANNLNASGLNFLGVDGGNGNAITCKILNDGSAEFAGEIVTGVRDSQGIFLTPGGAAESWVSGTRAWSLSSDGSAEFAGAIISGADPTSGASTGFQGNSSGVMRAAILW